MKTENLTNEEYVTAIETSNARLSKLLAVSEFQKRHLKKQVRELQEKITEMIRNSGKSSL